MPVVSVSVTPTVEGNIKPNEIKEFKECAKHNTRAEGETKVQAKKVNMEESLDSICGYLATATQAVEGSHEQTDYQYPTEVLCSLSPLVV